MYIYCTLYIIVHLVYEYISNQYNWIKKYITTNMLLNLFL